MTFSDVITFSDVNINGGVPWRPIQPLYMKHVICFYFYLSHGRDKVCEKRFAGTGVIRGDPYPVCEKYDIYMMLGKMCVQIT